MCVCVCVCVMCTPGAIVVDVSTCGRGDTHTHTHTYTYVFILLTPIQENGVKEEGEGQGEGAPDSSPQVQPVAVSPSPGLGEDDDDPLLEEGEVDMRAMMLCASFHARCHVFGHVTMEICATLSVVQSFVSFHLLSLCPPLPTDNTYTLHCVSTCSPVVQFLRVASRCSPILLTPEVPQPQPTDHSSCRGEGQGRGSLHRHQGTQQDNPSTSRPSESSYGDVCGAVMCEECGGWVCCVLVLQTMPYSQHKTNSVNQHCISLYVLYSARNMFKIIIGCDYYPLLVLRLPNDFLFHSEPKVARWDPLHQ